MGRLTSREANALAKAVSTLYVDQMTTPFATRVFKAIKQIASADWYALDSFHPNGYWLDESWVEPLVSVTHDEMLAFGAYCQEHPLFTAFINTGLPEPRKTTDYVSTQRFHRLNVYNEFFRRVGTDRQIVCGLPVENELTLVLSLNRNKTDFSDSHCRQIAALTPHLIAAHENAVALASLKFHRAQLESALEHSGVGAILLDFKSRARMITTRAESLLERYCERAHGTTAELPPVITNWVNLISAKYRSVGGVSPPLEISNQLGQLRVRFLMDSEARQILLLLTERTAAGEKDLESLGLTRRETEILKWLVQGKTNAEIALLCDVSERTVHKHLEHVYQKLGVETRIAAMQKALATSITEAQIG